MIVHIVIVMDEFAQYPKEVRAFRSASKADTWMWDRHEKTGSEVYHKTSTVQGHPRRKSAQL